MPYKYSGASCDQVRFLEEWFDTWLDYQKEDFLPVLVQALKPNDHVNGIINDISDIKIHGRRPSLFDCQIKLFHEWFHAFTPEEQSKFLNNLKEKDAEFYEKLNINLTITDKKDVSENVKINLNADVNGVTTTSVKEELTSAESSSTSPMSSISQPQSPQFSALDDRVEVLNNEPDSTSQVLPISKENKFSPQESDPKLDQESDSESRPEESQL